MGNSAFDYEERFVCNNCYEEFTDPVKSSDQFGDWIYICPFCGSEDFDRLFQCSCCGKWVPENEAVLDAYCDDCMNDSIKLMRDYMENGEPMDAEHRKIFLDYFNSL